MFYLEKILYSEKKAKPQSRSIRGNSCNGFFLGWKEALATRAANSQTAIRLANRSLVPTMTTDSPACFPITVSLALVSSEFLGYSRCFYWKLSKVTHDSALLSTLVDPAASV